MARAVGVSAFGKVGVLMGGWSAEREVSLASGQAVLAALQAQGIEAHGIDAGQDVLQVLQRGSYARIFNVWHGGWGEDGTLQGALELLRLPVTGSGVLASALAMDKWRCKLLWQAAGLPVPECMRLEADSDFGAVERALGLPLFVKPAGEGSSIGISKVTVSGTLREAWALAARHDPLVLAERHVPGGDYTVGIVRGQALPAIRIEPAGEFYDYAAKYQRDDTRYLCPCGLPPEREREMQALALQAFATLGCRGWGRVDFLLDEDGTPLLLELNTVPGMTDHSLVPMAAAAAGIDFPALVRRILEDTL